MSGSPNTRSKLWPGLGPWPNKRLPPNRGDNASHEWVLSGYAYTVVGAPVANATINVFRTDLNILVATTTSASNGFWSVQMPPAGGYHYYVTGYLANSPDIAGITVNTLQPI